MSPEQKLSREKAITTAWHKNRLKSIKEDYDLNDDDMGRIHSAEAGDPISDYYGRPEIQARMISAEKAGNHTDEQAGEEADESDQLSGIEDIAPRSCESAQPPIRAPLISDVALA